MDTLMVIPAIAFYYFVTENILVVTKSDGQSMEPTIGDCSSLLINKFSYKLLGKRVQKGDVVVSQSPVKPEIDICKRVIYTEGEYVYGIKIPPNHVWVEGDNKNNSFDSRDHGPLPECLIQGKVMMQLYPFKKIYDQN
ncbi:Imp1 inner mitochondrial membrane peptidase family protein, putative [Ichthyophthirius multifiliis]|uniref:Imp1 inner mitochondrial membrane peptidase family protein, putative n=1 Tax=Ichthyophthirius multifiliis TaxID=5932 RepID=G0QJK6_ICHMU|nr:Imp1 inner mitochondrial membrane peptidase family protein, putative [Ichthyophthirius multifiliis]EGR34607.1 Imp1 inner mitochondrial membrane peptidase family protein, putative [Ichthyophthirius multifiliis]|eukprot:XP_004039911.1 Imp1 inner mitochondrial membrane peptidase family protein, putative [Ichthyophthirius multifiliis]